MVKITSLQSRVLQFILQSIDANGVPPTLREIAQNFNWKAVGSAQDVLAALRRKGFLEPATRGRARQTLPTESAYKLLGFEPRGGLMQVSGVRARGRLNGKVPMPVPHTPTLWDSAFDENESSKSKDYPVSYDEVSETSAMVPLLGSVRAGLPEEAISQPDGYVAMPKHPRMKQDSIFYAVEVEGYSMIGAGMLPGDILLIEAIQQAKNGDIALAAVGPDQEVTVKRFVLKGSPHYRDALARTAYAESSKEVWPPALLVPENDDFEPIAFGLETSDRVVGLVRSLYRPEVRNL